MKQLKFNTAAGDSVKRYTSPRAKVVSVNMQRMLCESNPSLTGWSNDGSYSDGGEMGEEGE